MARLRCCQRPSAHSLDSSRISKSFDGLSNGQGGWGDAEQRPIERKLGLMENCRGQQLLTGDRVDYETLYLCNTLQRHFNCY